MEREAVRRLPWLLADLLEESSVEVVEEGVSGAGADVVVRDSSGRLWVCEVKTSSGPGQVERAAEQLKIYGQANANPLLVVPFMSKAGSEAADRARLNWIDLSGNASIRVENMLVRVQGHPNQFRSPGRPSSPFAPRSARVARALLLDPVRWWRQKDLADATGLDDGSVSRVVRRLADEMLLEQHGRELRPRGPGLLLDAWAQDYRFERHDVLAAHVSGTGIELARSLNDRLDALDVHHAFTGLAAAWALDQFARFRLTTVYVDGDPRDVAERLAVRVAPKGANVQLVGPDDVGVFLGEEDRDGLRCVSMVQVYLDLLHLPERADEAAQHLRDRRLNWHDAAA
ncbi:MAG: type IV toxin-antitoxin system AbiEi family antitoxin [Solirubrobacteraceae bacterium]